MRYAGWIKANIWQKQELKSLGVEGKIIYNHKEKCFEHCNCRYDIIERLIKYFKGFWPGCFTGLDLKKKPLPKEQQKYW